MNTILGELGKSEKFKDLLKNIDAKTSPISISGLTNVGITQIIAAINEFGKKPICILTYNEIQAKQIYQDLKYFTEKVHIIIYNKPNKMYYIYKNEGP